MNYNGQTILYLIITPLLRAMALSEHQCTPVRHTLSWKDFSDMLETLDIPDWLKEEAA